MRSQLQGQFRSEILDLEHLADFQLRLLIWATFGPADRLLERRALRQPEPGDEFLRLSEWPNRLPFAVFRKT